MYGDPVEDLGLNNIVLRENGNVVQQDNIVLSSALSTIPTSVAMVLDSSDTMTPFQDNVIAASKYFVGLLKTGDEAEIIKFAKTYELKQPFTSDNNALVAAIDNNYNDASTGCKFATLLYDALWYAIDTTANRPNNRSIVVISDGKDEDKGYCGVTTGGSVKTLTDVINHANENQVSIFTIGIGRIYGDVMTQLAFNTGGQYFATPNSDQLINIYDEIRHILDGQYVITYDSSHIGSSLITVDVEVFNVFDPILNAFLRGGISRQIQGCP